MQYKTRYIVIKKLSKYNSDPQIIYIHIAKLLLQYLKETMSFGLIYRRDAAYFIRSYKPYGIIEYTNNNYAGNLKNQKSIMSYCFFMNRAVVI